MTDCHRLKSDAWIAEESDLPRHTYFDDQGARVAGMLERPPFRPDHNCIAKD